VELVSCVSVKDADFHIHWDAVSVSLAVYPSASVAG
jgi:hypothetical protein